MRFGRAVALVTLLALGACASKANDPQVASAGSGPTPSATTTSQGPDAPLKFSQCMRDHGITWFPDPVDGRMTVNVPKGTDPKKMEAAQEACKQYAPDDGQPHKPTAEELQRARDMSKCMRENGVPNFPDPDPDGGLRVDGSKVGMGPGDPAFDKAQKSCDKFLPPAAKQNTGTNG